MKVHSIWEVFLPLQFTVGNKFNNSKLNQFSFEIDGVNFELLRKKETDLIDRMKIELYEEYDEKFSASHEQFDYISDFYKLVAFRAGLVAQKFLDGFSRNTDDENHQIFDGEDFITRYKFYTSPNIFIGSGNNGEEGAYYLDDELLINSIDFATKSKSVLDISWYLIRDAEHSMELGKYEISLIYMAIVIEFLITSVLTGFLTSTGEFKSQKHKEKIKELYGNKPSFVDKYFNYGLSLLTDEKLSDEVLNFIYFIYRVRNKLAHGKQLFEIRDIKDNNINELNVKSYWFDLINKTTEVHNFFYDSNRKLKLWG